MKRSGLSEERIIGVLRDQEAGAVVAELCRRCLHALLRSEGWTVKYKKAQRLHCEEGLGGASAPVAAPDRAPIPRPEGAYSR